MELPHTRLFFFPSFAVLRSHGTYSSPRMKVQALLFDLDGTLVDSIPIYKKAFAETLRAFGFSFTTEEFNDIYWSNRKLSMLLPALGLGHLETAIRKHRDDLYVRRLGEQVTWFEDAKSFADSFNGKIPRAIVTGSWQSFVDGIQRRVDLSLIASTIVTADDCRPYDKPHPHGLLLGAERLGIAPEHCMYVGDQDLDIQAARAANMANCLIVREHTPPTAHENATHVIHSLQELPAVLARMK